MFETAGSDGEVSVVTTTSVLEGVLLTALPCLPRPLIEVAVEHRAAADPDDVAVAGAADDWHRPFFAPLPVAPVEPADVAALRAAVEQVLAVDPASLPEGVALARAAELLSLSERLQAAVLSAVADVDAREAFTGAGAGSTRSWLRQSVTGDRGQCALGRRLGRFGQVHAGLGAGTVGLAAASHVTGELDRLPEQLPEDQLVGVLEHGLPDLLDVAFGGMLTVGRRTPEQMALAAELEQVVGQARAATSLSPAERLEPAFVLLARALPLRQLQSGTALLLDALEPERLQEREERARDARSWRLVKKRLSPGYRLEADLSVEDGLALQAEMDARTAPVDAAAAALARQGETAGTADATAPPARTADDTAAGSGLTGGATATSAAFEVLEDLEDVEDVEDLEDLEVLGADAPPPGPDRPVPPPEPDDPTGPPADAALPDQEPTAEQRRCDAFADLIRAAATARGSSHAHPFDYLITASLANLEAAAGVLPGTLTGPDGTVSLSAAALRRLGCGSALSLVLLDAARNPVGTSSTRRHATDRQRRALHARQGDLCGVAGCPNPWTVPHHVEPWWKTGRTVLKDLLGLCTHCHHDVHDGHRTLRLRDGRRLDEHGWVDTGDR